MIQTPDPLSQVLRSVRLKGGVFLDVRFSEPWCVYSQVVAEDCLPILSHPRQMISYHYVAEGRMLASVVGGDPISVSAGEIVLLPRNERHILASGPNIPPVDGRSLVQPALDGGLHRVVHGGGGAPARLICGFLGADEGFNPLIASLPQIVKVDVRAANARGMIESSMSYAASEIAEGRMASPSALAQLSELLFVEAIRRYAASANPATEGWLKGLTDPHVGKSLALIHQDIARSWTVEELADAAALSRSAFMERFKQATGLPPLRYLVVWRMHAAKQLLKESASSLARIASDVGYESEQSFSRAFKKEMGVAPSLWRKTD